MNQRQSEALGALLRQKRKELGYSTYQLAKAAHVDQSVVVRFEQGKFAAPRPDKLARFAQLLGMSLADVYARAGYVVPHDLPSFQEYLLAKYGDLPRSALATLSRCFEEVSTQFAAQIEEVLPNTEELANDAVGGTFG
jgi:transcriptional regulator with XRE-family HTH domain